MTETKYIYLLSLVCCLAFVLIPAVLLEINGGVPDVEPYGVLVIVHNILISVISLIASVVQIVANVFFYVPIGTLSALDSIPLIDFEDVIEAMLEDRINFLNTIDGFVELISNILLSIIKIISLMPVSLIIILIIPLVVTILFIFSDKIRESIRG